MNTYTDSYLATPLKEQNPLKFFYDSHDLIKHVGEYFQSRALPGTQMFKDGEVSLDGPDWRIPNGDVTTHPGASYSNHITGFFHLNK
jgi:hypothetical protein